MTVKPAQRHDTVDRRPACVRRTVQLHPNPNMEAKTIEFYPDDDRGVNMVKIEAPWDWDRNLAEALRDVWWRGYHEGKRDLRDTLKEALGLE